VWAFGCVLYEMLTAKRAFDGEDVSDTLASVLKGQPDWTALPAEAPTAIRRLLRRTLEKDSRRRLSDMADARLEIDDALGPPGTDISRETIQPGGAARGYRALPWTIAALLAGALIVTIVLWHPWRTPPSAVSQHLSVELGSDGSLGGTRVGTTPLAISPDGSMLAHRRAGSCRAAYLRRFGLLQATPLVTGQVSDPFFSPDGQWIGFFSLADRKLKKIPVAGARGVICEIRSNYPRGASWGDDGFIVFNAGAEAWTPLLRVPSDGGKPEPVSTLSEGEVAHRWPQVLPGARAMLFAAFGSIGGIDGANVLAQPLLPVPRRSCCAVLTSRATCAADISSMPRGRRSSQWRSTSIGWRCTDNRSLSSTADGLQGQRSLSFDVADNGTLSYRRAAGEPGSSHAVDAPQWDNDADAGGAARLEGSANFTRWNADRVPSGRRTAHNPVYVRVGA
jgi:hypothetical protein